MGSMIERMAQALADELGEGSPSDSLGDVIITGRHDLIAAAAAVLTAMREPTPEVLRAIHMCSTVDDWQEMIDAALGKEPQ